MVFPSKDKSNIEKKIENIDGDIDINNDFMIDLGTT